jgi:hypothetical protein
MYPFGKARSKAELEQMRRDYLETLKVEIENADVLEKKKRKPDEAPPVPPQYKTEAELRADIQSIDNELIQTIMNDFGYGYSSAVETIQGLSADDRVKLLALYPQFKTEIAKDAKRFKLLKPSFVNLRIRNFISKLNRTTGLEGLYNTVSTIEDLEKILPTDEQISKLQRVITNPTVARGINETLPSRFRDIMSYLALYLNAYPSLQQVFQMKKLNNTARTLLSQQLGSLIFTYRLMTNDDIDNIFELVNDYLSGKDVGDIGEIIQGKVGGAENMGKSLEQFANNWKSALATAGGENLASTEDIGLRPEALPDDFTPYSDRDIGKIADEIERQVEKGSVRRFGDVTYQTVRLDKETIEKVKKFKRGLRDLAEISGDAQAKEEVQDMISALDETVENRPNITLSIVEVGDSKFAENGILDVNEIDDRDEARAIIGDIYKVANEVISKTTGERIDELEEYEYENIMEDQEALTEQRLEQKREEIEERDLQETRMMRAKDTRLSLGFNRIRQIVKEFGSRPELLSSIVDEAINSAIEVTGDGSIITIKQDTYTSVEAIETLESIVRFVDDATNGYDANAKELVSDKRRSSRKNAKTVEGFGMKKGYHKMPDGTVMKDSEHNSGRISVKKLIGKGIEVQSQPTYKQFGKYVMHYPHLMNNVFNVKYPSLGSIPAIKPKTISDDYKEFVLEVFDTGKVNPRLFSNLDDEEKTHFHKVCKGAGLLEVFKLKKGETDEEKDDLNRFNLLKGSYIAGNNGESVIRELRGLISKFINEGRITKNEGLQMLMEIK